MRRSESRVDLARKHRLYMRNDEGKLRKRIHYIGYRTRAAAFKISKTRRGWELIVQGPPSSQSLCFVMTVC